MKKWDLIYKKPIEKSENFDADIKKILLENRGVSKKDEKDFFAGKVTDVTSERVGIDKDQLQKTLQRIFLAIEKKEQIVVYGDYDVDGICGAAILWEILYKLGAKVTPYIPHRIDEGYGLSIRGIENITSDDSVIKDVSLIITVDNGIVANDAVLYAKKKGIEVIVTDHHVVGEKLPDAFSIVHTTKLCGAAVAWMLGQEIKGKKDEDHLDLVALATVADLVVLQGANRVLLQAGLKHLQNTKRVGLLALFEEAGIEKKKLGVYEIGHIIAPRINAMGRLEYAMESLRLLCTSQKERAKLLAEKLGATNKERQLITQETVLHALSVVRKVSLQKKLLFIADSTYQPGVIGLVAGKLVEEFYRPSIVLSVGESVAKASARSIHGFNIIAFIREASHLLVDAGGHPMAAGFTVKIEKIQELQELLEEKALAQIQDEHLVRVLRVDCEIPLSQIGTSLYEMICSFAPFGMGNPEPTFVSKECVIEDLRVIGKEGTHLKLVVSDKSHHAQFSCVGFGLGEKSSVLHKGDNVSLVYTIDENTWNGTTQLQLKIKDIAHH